jgi:hypothetical protein
VSKTFDHQGIPICEACMREQSLNLVCSVGRTWITSSEREGIPERHERKRHSLSRGDGGHGTRSHIPLLTAS